MPTDREKLIEAVQWSRRRLATIEANIYPLTINGNRDNAESCLESIKYAEQIFDAFEPTIVDAISIAAALAGKDKSNADLDEIVKALSETVQEELRDARQWAERILMGGAA